MEIIDLRFETVDMVGVRFDVISRKRQNTQGHAYIIHLLK